MECNLATDKMVHRARDAREIWKETLQYIEDQISRPSYLSWFQDITPYFEGKHFVIETSSAFTTEWLRNRYYHIITNSLLRVDSSIAYIEFRTNCTDDYIYNPWEKKNGEGISRNILEVRLNEMEEKLDSILMIIKQKSNV